MRITLVKAFLWIALLPVFKSDAQQTFVLYDGKIPNALEAPNLEYSRANSEVDSLTFNVSIPTLTVYRPKAMNDRGTAIIICPGGGYHVLLSKREGSDVAKAFASVGVTAFVLKYRLPSEKTMAEPSLGPLQDAQEAIKFVRQNAKNWHLDPERIGVMGFSAGGHVASSAGTHFEKSLIPNEDRTSLRPDFMVLVNPVISFQATIGHAGSRHNLLGKSPSYDKIQLFSNEAHISPTTPMTFLVHSSEDKVVPVANSLVFYNALVGNGISAEMHLYATGEHGFLTAPPFEEWFGRCVNWMKAKKMLR